MRNRLLGAVCRATVLPFYRRRLKGFERRCENGQLHQNCRLLSWIARSASTDWGREHGFSTISTIDDFRSAVPISDYASLAPYLTRVAEGRVQALLPEDEPIIAFASTSGSTGTPKIFPVTRTWLRDYQRQWRIWGAKAVSDDIGPSTQKWLQISAPSNLGTTASGHQIGMASAITAKHQNALLGSFFATPAVLGDIADTSVRNYLILRRALLEDIGFIITTTATNLLSLARFGDAHKEELIRDIHDGACRTGLDALRALAPGLALHFQRKSPRRARELEMLAKRLGALLPRHYWNVRCVGCWTGGTVGYQAHELPACYGDVVVRDIGYVSTEGRHTIPLSSGTADGALVHEAFYEFQPIGSDETLLASALEPGGRYEVIVTTSNGLYRYRLGDIVTCKGFMGDMPLLRFEQKTAEYSDMEGEKLSAMQVASAMEKVRAADALSQSPFCLLAVRGAGVPAHYLLVLEGAECEDTRLHMAAALDTDLQSQNVMYKQKRNDGSLAAIVAEWVPPGAWSQYAAVVGEARGTGETQFKLPVLLSGSNAERARELVLPRHRKPPQWSGDARHA